MLLANARDCLVVDSAPPGNLTVGPTAPLAVFQQEQDGPALVGVGPAQAVGRAFVLNEGGYPALAGIVQEADKPPRDPEDVRWFNSAKS